MTVLILSLVAAESKVGLHTVISAFRFYLGSRDPFEIQHWCQVEETKSVLCQLKWNRRAVVTLVGGEHIYR